MRSCFVEMDKTVGTQWPPESVQHQGASHTLEGIYERAGFQLDVQRRHANLALPQTGAKFDLRQLHRFMLAHPSSAAGGQWQARILIVPRIEYVSGGRLAKPLGVMFDLRAANENDLPREGCAMSFQRVSTLDQRAYMRTLSHELGHVFNLLHPKHENPPRPISTTLMNQTMDLQFLGDFPNNISFEFEPANQQWLLKGPSDFVRPGGRPFGSRPADAADLGIADAAADSEGVAFEMTTRAESYDPGEPFYVRFSLRNTSDEPMAVDPVMGLHNQTVTLEVIDPLNRARPFRPAYIECLEGEVTTLEPGQELLGNSVASYDGRGQVFSYPGIYRLRATYSSRAGEKEISATADEIEIEVKEPESAGMLDLADAMAPPEMGLFFVLRGGGHIPRVAKAWSDIVEAHSEKPFAQAAKIALAQSDLSKHPGKAAGRRALEMLESVAEEYLDYEQLAEKARLMIDAGSRIDMGQVVSRAADTLGELALRIDPSARELGI